MLVSGDSPLVVAQGQPLSSLLGAPHGLLNAFAGLRERSFQAFFPLHSSFRLVKVLCLVISIPLTGFSVTVPLVVAARRVAMDTSVLPHA